MSATLYFQEQVLRKRPYLTEVLCRRVIANPLRRETQADGRVRFWALIPVLGNRALRVVTLEDGQTLHNAFLDRGFHLIDNEHRG